MSIHLLECAANRTLPASTKLALMAFADSADKYTHIAFPGLDQVQRWANIGRSRASEVVGELVDLGLLHKHRPGHRGRRAEYVVFPNGCCDEHRREPVDEDRDADPFPAVPATGKGSAGPDSLSLIGATTPDPLEKGSAGPDPLTGKGAGKGPLGRTPPLTTNYNPPPPGEPGEPSCAKHPTGAGPNCRHCGTTNRQIQKRTKREAADRTRADELLRRQAEREAAAARAVPVTALSPATTEVITEARRLMATNRSRA